jgi:hypothetical protein
VALFALSWGLLHVGPLGRDQIVDTPVYERYGAAMTDGLVPYRDFALEYPPGALPAFLVPALGPQEHFRSLFEALMAACGAAAVALAVAALARAGGRSEHLFAAAAVMGLAPLMLGSVVLTRFDFWPAALVAGALAALVSGRGTLACAVLGLAATAKLYPLVLLPLFLLHLRGRGAGRGLVGFAAAVLVVVLPFAAIAPEGLWDSVDRQLSRPLQVESLGAALLLVAHRLGLYEPTVVSTFGSQNLDGALPDALATMSSALQVTAIVAVWVGFARGRADERRLLVAAAAAIAAFVAFGKVLSPQFLVWLVPLVPLVAGPAGVAASGLFVAALVATHLLFPSRYWDLVALGGEAWLVLARNLLLVGLVAVLLAALRPGATALRRAGPRSS